MDDDLVRKRGRAIVVDVDGACLNNGKFPSWAGIGVFWDYGNPYNVSEPLCDYRRVTNQRAEICAAIEAMNIAANFDYDRMIIRTDSKYLIDCATKHINKWQQNGWLTSSRNPVANKEDWENLLDAQEMMNNVRYEHVAGHQGDKCNEMANQLAQEGARKARDN